MGKDKTDDFLQKYFSAGFFKLSLSGGLIFGVVLGIFHQNHFISSMETAAMSMFIVMFFFFIAIASRLSKEKVRVLATFNALLIGYLVGFCASFFLVLAIVHIFVDTIASFK